MINRKGKGRSWEYKVRDYLRDNKCFVIRQASSTFPDLIAVKTNGKIMAVECKTSKGGLSKKERNKLISLHSMYKMLPYVAYPKYSCYSEKKGNIVLKRVKNG